MLACDRISLPLFLVCCVTIHSGNAADEALDESANPWLRPHFTVSIKSSESFDVIKNMPVDSGIRKAFPDGLFANLVEAVHPGLLAGISLVVRICDACPWDGDMEVTQSTGLPWRVLILKVPC